MKEKRRSMQIHVGSTSIVMIFAVLCLTVFSSLSFVTAYHEKQLAEKAALAAEQYYAADWQCEERYAQIVAYVKAGGDLQQLNLDGVQVTKQESGYHITYAAGIDAEQKLQVKLLVQPNGVIDTQQWKVVAARTWDYQEDIQVWDGQ